MREYADELVKMVNTHREGVAAKAFTQWETRAGRSLPDDVKTLYEQLDGGDFPGEVKLLSFAEISSQVPENLIVLGTRASVPETVLLMLTRADFEAHSDSRPSWLESLSLADWMFALRKGEGADLKPARTFMGLLERVIPPRETETFGEATFARGLSAVASALENLPEEVTDGTATPIGTSGSALVAVRTAAKPAQGKSKKKTPVPKRKSVLAKRKAVARPAKKKKAAKAAKPAKRASSKKVPAKKKSAPVKAKKTMRS